MSRLYSGSRRRFLAWAGAVALGVGAGAYGLWRRTAGPFRPSAPEPPAQPQTPPGETRGPSPREGPTLPQTAQTPEQIDHSHQMRIATFPAKTAGQGGQRLPFRMENGVKVFELTPSVIQWEVEPGKFVEAWAYNEQVPGPEIRVTEGDRVRVIVHNKLQESTSVHWHGMRIRNDMDGVPYLTQDPIPAGQSFTYEFTPTPAGTHMYHSHHNSTKQVAMGLLGALIVEPRDKSREPRYDKEQILVLNDGPLGYTINGKSFPATQPITAKVGQRVRLRWMHEGAMIHPMHLHGLPMEVFARDGIPLPQPFTVDTLTIAPGERWDCIVPCNLPGKWALHCHVLPHAEGEIGMFGLVTVFIVEP